MLALQFIADNLYLFNLAAVVTMISQFRFDNTDNKFIVKVNSDHRRGVWLVTGVFETVSSWSISRIQHVTCVVETALTHNAVMLYFMLNMRNIS